MLYLILAVLIIIAIVLAPWLLGVAAVAAAAYGVYMVVFAALMGLAVVAGFIWAVVTSIQKPATDEAPAITGGRVACRQCQAEVSDKLARCDNCGAPLQ